MSYWVQIILAVVGGGAITTAIQRFNLLKSDKRKGDADAERVELENDNIRFEGYVATINDLNDRLSSALSKMRELEEAISNANTKNIELKAEILRLNKTIVDLKSELDESNYNVVRLEEEVAELKKRLEEE